MIKLTKENFLSEYKLLLTEALAFGGPGEEFINNKRNSVKELPQLFLSDINGDPLDPLQSKYPLNASKTAISPLGEQIYLMELKSYQECIIKNEANTSLWLLHLLNRCSPESIVSMNTIGTDNSGPQPILGFMDAKRRKDTFRITEILLQTHLYGNARSKQRHFTDLVGAQQSGTHESFLMQFSEKCAQVCADFESTIHPGYIDLDVLFKCFYLNGIHQSFFSRQIDRAHEEMPTARLAAVQALCQSHALEAWDAFSSGPSSFSVKANIAGAMLSDSNAFVGKVSSSSGGSSATTVVRVTGKYDLSRPECHGACAFCWNKSFLRKDHALPDCIYSARAMRRAAPSVSAHVAATPTLPSATLPLQVVHSPSNAVGLSDAAFISAFESNYSAYVDAKRRSGTMDVSSGHAFVAAVTLMPDFNFRGMPMLPPVAAVSSSPYYAPFVQHEQFLQHNLAVSVEALRAFAHVSHLRNQLPVDWYWDNCASVHVVNDLAYLMSPRLLDVPFEIGGISSGVVATHSGLLPFLPAPFNVAYFAARATACLLSLGSLQRLGGVYTGEGAVLRVYGHHGCLLDHTMLQGNNLSPVSAQLLASRPLGSLPLNASADSFIPFVAASPTASSCDVALVAPLMVDRHYTAEQRARCDRAESLHQGQAVHCSDDVLCEALTNGEYAHAHVTAADVRLNRLLRGNCPQCAEGKLRARPFPASVIHAPATSCGEILWIDLHQLPCPSVGGNTVALRVQDEFSGEMMTWPATSGSTPALFMCIMENLARYFKPYGHVTSRIIADADPKFSAGLVTSLGSCHGDTGILLTFCSPGSFAKRIENAIYHEDDRRRAVLAGLPFFVPPKYHIYLMKWMDDCQASLPNECSRPSSPIVLRTGARRQVHYTEQYLSIFSVCLVRQFADKRAAEARKGDHAFASEVPRSELGVLLGYSYASPGNYDFLLTNGQIVPREVCSVVQVHPFDWKKRTVLHADMRPPSDLPTLSGQYVVATDPVSVSLDDGSSTSSVVAGNGSLGSSDFAQPVAVSHVVSGLLPTTIPIDSSSSINQLHNPTSTIPVGVVASPEPISNRSTITPPLPILPVVSPMPLVSVASDSRQISIPVPLVVVPPVSVGSTTRVSSRGAAHPPGFWRKAAFPAMSKPTLKKVVPAPSIGEWTLVGRPVAVPILPMLDHFVSMQHVDSSVGRPSVNPLPHKRVHTGATRSNTSRRHSASSLPSKPFIAATGFTVAEIALIDAYVLADKNLKDTAWFNTMRVDEFDLDSASAYYNGAIAADSDFDGSFRSSLQPALLMSSTKSSYAFVRATAADLRPIPSSKGKELPLSQALHSMHYDKLVRTTKVEIEKQQRIGCIGTKLFTRRELPHTSLQVRAHAIYKDKADGRETCRIAAMGNKLPRDPDVLTSSTVASDEEKAFSLSLMQAYCKGRGEIMQTADADIVGGFLRIKRDSSTRMFLQFPHNLPHPYAGLFVEVFGALYGLYESNRLFSEEVHRVLLAAGFRVDPKMSKTYVKELPNGEKIFVSVHVDDFRGMTNYRPFIDQLFAALVERFVEVTYNAPSVMYTGVELRQHSNGACEQLQSGYMERVAARVGIVHLDNVSTPCDHDIFKLSVSADDCVAVDTKRYCALTGYLIQMLKTRDEIRPFVSTLCARNAKPTVGDFNKAIHLLRYLYCTRQLGRVFDSSSTQLVGYADAAFGLHHNGCSAEAGFICVGASNAPFMSVAKAQFDVATCPMTAEYMSAGTVSRMLQRFIDASEALGIAQGADVLLVVDNSTAKSLATAPEITRKSLHIHIKYHYIRELIARHIIKLQLVRSKDMRADILTKFFPPAQFKRLRDSLLNRAALPVLQQ